MDADQGTEAAREERVVTDKLYMENTLLRVSGALFCHDAKRAATHTEEIILNAGIAEKAIVIRPDPRLGQPGPLAHKIFVALIKKHSDYGRAGRDQVTFSRRELMRLIGRNGWGGADSEQLSRALNEIHHAFIRTSFKTEKGRLAEHSFNVFPEVYLERAEHPTDPIETCVVTIARPVIASLQDDHFTCLNFTLMRDLGTIGQALYARLFFHFANLFDGHHRARLRFQKRYSDVCVEWLGGLKVLPYRSMIEREQLGTHLRQLVRVGFLASYSIREAANADGFVLAFRPGAAFFTDYDRFYRRRSARKVEVAIDTGGADRGDPVKLAYRFLEKRTGRALESIPYVSSKEVATARQILGQISFDQIDAFLSYALRAAKRTNFEVQSLGGLRQYVAGFQQHRSHQLAEDQAVARRRATEREDTIRLAYGQFWRSNIERLFASLSKREQSSVEEQARAALQQSGRGDGPLAKTLLSLERCRITAARYPDRIPSFDEWRRRVA